jgi:hypothetical protein
MPENKLDNSEQVDAVEQEEAAGEEHLSYNQQMLATVEEFLTVVEKKKIERILRDASKYAKLSQDKDSYKYLRRKYSQLIQLIDDVESWQARHTDDI